MKTILPYGRPRSRSRRMVKADPKSRDGWKVGPTRPPRCPKTANGHWALPRHHAWEPAYGAAAQHNRQYTIQRCSRCRLQISPDGRTILALHNRMPMILEPTTWPPSEVESD